LSSGKKRKEGREVEVRLSSGKGGDGRRTHNQLRLGRA